MKKYFVFFAIFFLFITQNVFAEIQSWLDSIDDGIVFLDWDDGLKGPALNDPLTDNLTFINQLSIFLVLIFIVPGIIGLYLCPSLGISSLSKKYAPKINPVLSWIPLVRIYPLMKSLWISGWWSLTLYIPMLPVIISEISQKMWGWIGWVLLFIFLPHFSFAYLGLKENWKPTWPAWVFGLSAALIIAIFFVWIFSGFTLLMFSAEIIQD